MADMFKLGVERTKRKSAPDVTPQDILEYAVSDIETGVVTIPKKAIIIVLDDDPDTEHYIHLWTAGMETIEALGCLEFAKKYMGGY